MMPRRLWLVCLTLRLMRALESLLLLVEWQMWKTHFPSRRVSVMRMRREQLLLRLQERDCQDERR